MIRIYIDTTARGPRKGICTAGYLLQAGEKAYGIAVRKLESVNRYSSLVRTLAEAAGHLKAGDEAVTILADDEQIVTEIYRIRKREQSGWTRSDGKPIAEAEAWTRLNRAIRGRNYEARVPEPGDRAMNFLNAETKTGTQDWRIEHV